MDKKPKYSKRLKRLYKDPKNWSTIDGPAENWVKLDSELRSDLAASLLVDSRSYLKNLAIDNSGFIYGHQIDSARGLANAEWEFAVADGEIFMRSIVE
jgi:hypothetical protein